MSPPINVSNLKALNMNRKQYTLSESLLRNVRDYGENERERARQSDSEHERERTSESEQVTPLTQQREKVNTKQ